MIAADPNEETRKAVARFLEDFNALTIDQKPKVIPREKNRDVLISLGLTLKNQWDILRSLTVEDYVAGPEPDRQRKGDVWMFGVKVQTTELYIKLKLVEYIPLATGKPVREAVCISFHPAEYPLTYPLK